MISKFFIDRPVFASVLSIIIVLGAALAARVGSKVGLVLGGLLVAGGLFSLFEANRGWCAARALGFKTKF